MMIIRAYKKLPYAAMDIRIRVFVEEQGFVDELDDTDAIATHIVAYVNKKAVATCRFVEYEKNSYILGRIAVVKEYRGQGLGATMLNRAQALIKKAGGEKIMIHSQLHARGFYEFCGYTVCSETEEEQGVPHVWLKKEL